MPEHCEVRRSIVFPHTVMIFIESDVQHPVQGVFDAPMATRGFEHLKGIANQARDEVTRFDDGLAVYAALADDLDNRAQVAPTGVVA